MKMISVNVKFFVFSILSNPEDLILGKKHWRNCICSFPLPGRFYNTAGFRAQTKDQVYDAEVLYK
jgi:hypothetical protein